MWKALNVLSEYLLLLLLLKRVRSKCFSLINFCIPMSEISHEMFYIINIKMKCSICKVSEVSFSPSNKTFFSCKSLGFKFR